MTPSPTRTIGVFDSGFGGLTVLRALLTRLPNTHFVYLGDTARLPYGAKSQQTVARYAVEAARFLVHQGAELLVIACNTATALALPEIRAAVRPIPVLGVVEPGAQAALTAASSQQQSLTSTGETHPHQTVISAGAKRSGEVPVLRRARTAGTSPSDKQKKQPQILVLATVATVASHAYRDTCATLNLQAKEMPCPLLVPLVEEGWTDHPVTREVLRIYLTEALAQTTPDAVVLGCTHYPLIAPLITQTLRDLGCQAAVVDSAEATAEAAHALIKAGAPSSPATGVPGELARWGEAQPVKVGSQDLPEKPPQDHPSTFTCYATDSTEKFARLGTHFLGQPIPQVHLLDLGG